MNDVKFNGNFQIGGGFPVGADGFAKIGTKTLVTADRQATSELLLEFKARLEQEALKMAREIEMAGYEISSLSIGITAGADLQKEVNEAELF